MYYLETLLREHENIIIFSNSAKNMCLYTLKSEDLDIQDISDSIFLFQNI